MWLKAAAIVVHTQEEIVEDMLREMKNASNDRTAAPPPRKTLFGRAAQQISKGLGAFANVMADEWDSIMSPEARALDRLERERQEEEFQESYASLKNELLRIRTKRTMRAAANAFTDAGRAAAARREADALQA